MDVPALEGQAVEGNEQTLDCAVLSGAEGILEVLRAESGGTCGGCGGKVADGLFQVTEAVAVALNLEVMPEVRWVCGMGASTFEKWRGRRLEDTEFGDDRRVLGVMAALGEKEVNCLARSTKVRIALRVVSSRGDAGLVASWASQAARRVRCG